MNCLPERLSISIGGHFGPSYSVELAGGLLTYRWSRPVQQFPPEWESSSEQIEPSDERWRAFRAALDRIDVWRWQPAYFEPVCDGTSWTAEIVYPDTAVRSHGSNCFPGPDDIAVSFAEQTKEDTFERFCRAVSTLVGRRFR